MFPREAHPRDFQFTTMVVARSYLATSLWLLMICIASWFYSLLYGGFLSHRAAPSHHPFLDWISLRNHPAIKGYPHWWKPPYSPLPLPCDFLPLVMLGFRDVHPATSRWGLPELRWLQTPAPPKGWKPMNNGILCPINIYKRWDKPWINQPFQLLQDFATIHTSLLHLPFIKPTHSFHEASLILSVLIVISHSYSDMGVSTVMEVSNSWLVFVNGKLPSFEMDKRGTQKFWETIINLPIPYKRTMFLAAEIHGNPVQTITLRGVAGFWFPPCSTLITSELRRKSIKRSRKRRRVWHALGITWDDRMSRHCLTDFGFAS